MKLFSSIKQFYEVHSPDHYVKGRDHHPLDVINDWNLNFNLGNVVKYIARYKRKKSINPLTDLKKAAFYLNKQILDDSKNLPPNLGDKPEDEMATIKAQRPL